MELLIKITLLCGFALIAFQDIKERQVYVFLFPIIALSCAGLSYLETTLHIFNISVLMNGLFILLLMSVVVLYTKFKLKVKFSEAFGLGDVILFIALIFSFATVTFIIVFVFALLFSLITHVIFKKKTDASVPLAGYMSVFFGLTYIGYWFGLINSVYIL